MERKFQLYQGETSKLKSSLFDLISGDLESKQMNFLTYHPGYMQRIGTFDNDVRVIVRAVKRSLNK